MSTKYLHTNIVSKDYRRLADFYIKVFDCVQKKPESKMSGDWLEKGTGVKKASLKSIDLLFPGYGRSGPTLEIFQYNEMFEKSSPPAANKEGFGHIAFQVDDVATLCEKIISLGGGKLGELVSKEFKSGTLTYIYATDPEGNIIEISNWKSK